MLMPEKPAAVGLKLAVSRLPSSQILTLLYQIMQPAVSRLPLPQILTLLYRIMRSLDYRYLKYLLCCTESCSLWLRASSGFFLYFVRKCVVCRFKRPRTPTDSGVSVSAIFNLKERLYRFSCSPQAITISFMERQTLVVMLEG